MRRSQMEPDVISYNAAISACDESQQWEKALSLLPEMCVVWVGKENFLRRTNRTVSSLLSKRPEAAAWV